MADFSIADILARGYQQRKDLLSQPYGFSNVLPAAGQVAQQGFQLADNNRKQTSVMQAQKDYSDYLSKSDAGMATPEDHQKGYAAALSLGINPKPQTNIAYADPRLMAGLATAAGVPTDIKGSKENIAAAEKLASLKKKPIGTDQSLSPEEMNALKGAMGRAKNPLPASMISFKGPRAKLMAQSLMSDPNWSPIAGEAGLASAKTGAEATARVQGGKGFEIGALGGTVEDTLNKLEPLIPKLGPNKLAILNKAYQAGLQQVNDPDVNKALVYLNEATALQASVLKGGGAPTDEDIKLARPYFNQGLNPAAFAGMREAIRNVNESRTGRLQGKIQQSAPSSSNSALLDKYGTP